MWQTKKFKTHESLVEWYNSHKSTYQMVEVFINNGYALEVKKRVLVY